MLLTLLVFKNKKKKKKPTKVRSVFKCTHQSAKGHNISHKLQYPVAALWIHLNKRFRPGSSALVHLRVHL